MVDAFKICDMEQALIVFGATVSTAKEAFFINFPKVSKDHSYGHSEFSQITKKVIMYVLTLLDRKCFLLILCFFCKGL